MTDYKDLLNKAETRPNDAPIPTEHLIDDLAEALRQLKAQNQAAIKALEMFIELGCPKDMGLCMDDCTAGGRCEPLDDCPLPLARSIVKGGKPTP